MRSAPRFQLVMMPSRFLLTIASSLDSTIDGTSATAVLFREAPPQPLAVGNVDSRGMQEHHRSGPVANGMHGKIDDTFAAVGPPISKLFAKTRSRGCLAVAVRIFAFVSSEPRHQGVSENGRSKTCSRVYPHAFKERSFASRR